MEKGGSWLNFATSDGRGNPEDDGLWGWAGPLGPGMVCTHPASIPEPEGA